MLRTVVVLPFLLAIGTYGAGAWGQESAEKWKPTEITISAQAIETPAMKYRLLPTESELRPGNAATILLRLPWEETIYFTEVVPTFREWVSKPLDDPAWKDSQGVLDANFYAEMKRAAFRRDADWEYPLGEKPIDEIQLPDAQGARALIGYGLSAKARYHIGRREFDLAREAILVSLADTRHYAKSPFTVVQLICAVITNLTFDRVDELVGMPGSPNLYWALSTLPRPLFDLRPTGEIERLYAVMTVPGLADLEKPRTNEQWCALFDDYYRKLIDTGFPKLPAASKEIIRRQLTKHAHEALPKLLGVAPSAIAAMSDDEVILRWYAGQHARDSQLATALECLPPPEAIDRLVELNGKAKEEGRNAGLTGEQIPGFVAVFGLDIYSMVWNLQRRIDALRIVEAIRNHLALHSHLPEQLSDITAVSIPADPLTAEAFAWTVENNVGRLSAKTIVGLRDRNWGQLEYVIRVR